MKPWPLKTWRSLLKSDLFEEVRLYIYSTVQLKRKRLKSQAGGSEQKTRRTSFLKNRVKTDRASRQSENEWVDLAEVESPKKIFEKNIFFVNHKKRAFWKSGRIKNCGRRTQWRTGNRKKGQGRMGTLSCPEAKPKLALRDYRKPVREIEIFWWELVYIFDSVVGKYRHEIDELKNSNLNSNFSKTIKKLPNRAETKFKVFTHRADLKINRPLMSRKFIKSIGKKNNNRHKLC